MRWVQLCSSLNILWLCLCLSFWLKWKLTFSSPVVTVEFSIFFFCLFVWVLWKMLLVVWSGLHWIYRLDLIVYSFSQYWFFQSTNMVYLSNCLCHLWLLSSVSYSSLCTGPLSLLVDLFLVFFFFFSCNGEWDGFLNFSFYFSLLVCKNARDFCVLILYPLTSKSLISSSNFLVAFLGFLCIVTCHLQTVRILLFFQSGFLLFLFFSDCHG